MKASPIIFVLYLIINVPTDGAKILCVFNVPSYSHHIVFQPIWVELARRGHDMVVMTPYILENNTFPNLRQIDLKWTYSILHKHLSLSYTGIRTWRQQFLEQQEATMIIDQAILENDIVKKVLEEEKHFDLVVVQWFNPVMMALGAKYKCPLITISSLNAYNFMHEALGNPTHPVLHPEYMTGLEGELTFKERLQSTFFALWQKYYYWTSVIPKADKIVKKCLGPNLPSLSQIQYNISFEFLNVNPLVTRSRPNVANIIEFTGMHIKPYKPLPEDLQTFLDNAKEGVIYLSLGTNVKSALLPTTCRQTIIDALSELPYKVLWKYEEDTLPNKPENVMIKKWMPQQDILGHKNVKLYIMQGGSQSLEEAIHKQVPIIGIPFFSDQPRNIKIATKIGIGLGVDIKTVTKDELKSTILEVINNKKYKNTIVAKSQLIKDQPMTSLDKVVWWIEYTLRHKGAIHLRSPYSEISFWKYMMLDQIIVLSVIFIILLYISVKILKYCMRFIKDNIRNKVKTQ